MGKNLDDLEISRQKRIEIIREFGCIPESIMKHNKNTKSVDSMAENRSYYTQSNNGGYIKKSLANIFDVSGQSVRSGALSRFTQNVGKILIKLYSKEKNIVLDPFAGHNSRMELCFQLNRTYWGQDISEQFMKANFEVRENLIKEVKNSLLPNRYIPNIELKTGDSRKLLFPDSSADFTITSPPYWNLEYYGDETGQLGLSKTYQEFLNNIQLVMKENHRCLKVGSFCVWFVNDFRKNGEFYNYHGHTIQLMRKAGFSQFDIMIVDLGTSIRAAFASQIVETKILPKRHEYALIFRKKG